MAVQYTREQAQKLGLILPDVPKGKKRARSGDTVRIFDERCRSYGLPIPVHEYAFAPWEGGEPGCRHVGQIFLCKHCGASRRKWRFDWLFGGWLAVEQVGGVWTNGHHSRGKDQIDDMEKRNNAVLLGYAVLEFTPQQFSDGSAFAFIARVLGSKEEQP